MLYGWHPLHLAKYGAVIDRISGGRWGLNTVTCYRAVESRMFGFDPIAHDERYAMADEFTTVMKRLGAAGVDGAQVNFYDFGPDLDRFACTVLPLMHEAGLRNPEPVGPQTGSAA